MKNIESLFITILLIISPSYACTGNQKRDYSDSKSINLSTTTTSSSKWTSLVGKKLTLVKYGLIGNGGSEVNTFYNNTNEYVQLQSNGVMIWNNRQDGNSNFYYIIDSNKLYFGSTKGSRQYYFEIVNTNGNMIKTHDKIGTYRYFNCAASHASGSTNVPYLDILRKYAPFYYKRNIISSERIKDNDYEKQYRYYDSAGFEINVHLMNCGFCQGGGKNPYNGQFCGMCFGQGWIININAWNKETSVMLDCDGKPVYVGVGGSTTHSSGSNNSGSSSGGSSGSGSIYTTCRICNGSGRCTSCNGRGTSLYTYGGSDHTVCSSCHGNGRCFNCHGTGRQ